MFPEFVNDVITKEALWSVYDIPLFNSVTVVRRVFVDLPEGT